MKARVWTAPPARVQARRAALWWRENRPSAPSLFSQELTGALELLADNPEIGPLFPNPHVPGARRLLLSGSRYHVYYVYDPVERQVAVLAVWNAVRGRGPVLRLPRR